MRVAAFLAAVAALCALSVVGATAAGADDTLGTGLSGGDLTWGGGTGTGLSGGEGMGGSSQDLTDGLLGVDALSAGAMADAGTVDLALTGLMNADAIRAAEAARAALEARRAAAMSNQTEVGPDGCPVTAPARGVQTSGDIDLNDVCARSVADARTGAAAKAIKYALTHLAVPYSQAQRNQEGYYDCSSFFSRAYEETGLPIISKYNGANALVTWQFVGGNGYSALPFSHEIPFEDARAGDAILTADLGHMAMKLVDGLMAESPNSGQVSRVIGQWFSGGRAAWIDPSAV